MTAAVSSALGFVSCSVVLTRVSSTLDFGVTIEAVCSYGCGEGCGECCVLLYSDALLYCWCGVYYVLLYTDGVR